MSDGTSIAMKIARISAYRVLMPLRQGSFRWSLGKSVSTFDSTIVAIETDCGLVGWGEVCPLGSSYLPGYAAGDRTGIAELAPHLIGDDPRQVDRVYKRMDGALRGHAYVKSALDIACWDLLGQAAGLPVCVLLGGHLGDDLMLYRGISLASPQEMAAAVAEARAEGYRRFQLKVGGEVEDDIARIRTAAAGRRPGDVLVADANGAWLVHEAVRVVRAIADTGVWIEQPCLTYAECLEVRRRTDLPFLLDESIDSQDTLLRAHGDGAMDGVTIKITRLGGLTPARRMRDLCVALGIPMTIEDSAGGDLAVATVAHLAQSTPPAFRFPVSASSLKVSLRLFEGAPRPSRCSMAASTEPGLGVHLRRQVLGDPVFAIG